MARIFPRLALVFLSLFLSAVAAGDSIKYADLLKGDKKLPYGKSVVLTGKLSELKCDSQKLPGVLTATAIQATYLGQKTTPGAGTVEGDNWSAPLGVLPSGVSIQLRLKITGAITRTRSGAVVSALVASDQFQRELKHYFNVTLSGGPAVREEEARRFLRNLSDQQGALTAILRQQAPCVTSTETIRVLSGSLHTVLSELVSLDTRAKDLTVHELDAFKGITSAAAAYQVITTVLKTDADYKKAGQPLVDQPPSEPLSSAKRSVEKFKRDYEAAIRGIEQQVVAELAQAVEMDATVDTSDLEKYAGFDVGAIYVPRVDELRQFFMVHVYPLGPVELDTNGPLKGGWSRFSLAFGMSLGDFSGREGSRISNQNVFVYGVGYRLNKYFRISAGAALYREASPRNGLLHEAFIGPSIDITALPGLRQIFSRAASNE